MTTHVKENFADSGNADPVSRTRRKAWREKRPSIPGRSCCCRRWHPDL